MPELITRAEARAQDLKRYFTGKPCKHGHVAEKFVANETCVICNGDDYDVWRKANPKKHYGCHKSWARVNRGTVRAHGRRSYKNNPAPYKARAKARRALKLDQTCTCCTPAQLEQPWMIANYTLFGGQDLEVDHVVALGLGGPHCCHNLQLLTEDEHHIKTAEDHRLIRRLK